MDGRSQVRADLSWTVWLGAPDQDILEQHVLTGVRRHKVPSLSYLSVFSDLGRWWCRI